MLVARTARRNNRPLLKQGRSPREVLEELMNKRYPIYQQADITVNSDDCPIEDMVERVLKAIEHYLGYSVATKALLPEMVEDSAKITRIKP